MGDFIASHAFMAPNAMLNCPCGSILTSSALTSPARAAATFCVCPVREKYAIRMAMEHSLRKYLVPVIKRIGSLTRHRNRQPFERYTNLFLKDKL